MNPKSHIGDFTILGFTRRPEILLQHQVPERLGVTPCSIALPNSGAFFFHTTYGEVAESNSAILLKLGFLRSSEKSALSARQILDQGIAKPGGINSGQLSGNAMLVCLGKKEAVFSAYKTLLGVPQLYYAEVEGGLICSDRLKCLVQLLDRVDINEEIIPLHYLFRSTPGDLTYYRQIRRMLPGELLRFEDGRLSRKIVQDFQFSTRANAAALTKEEIYESIYASLHDIVTDYSNQVDQKGEQLANLLSGGVDSSILQHLINEQTSNPPARSYSFAVRVPSFQNEIDYAQQASQLFHTQHTFVDIQPEDYLGLISRTIETLAQPPILETEPAMLSVAEYASRQALPIRYFMSGQGADTNFGLQWSRKLKGLHLAGKMPGAVWLLKATGTALKPLSRLSQVMLKGGDILASSNDPEAFLSPANSIVVYADPVYLRRSFGDEVLRNVLQNRRTFTEKYICTDHYLEKVHVIDLLTDTYEIGVQRHQLFLGQGREQIQPFFDDEILRQAFAIPPDRRYIQGLEPKYILREILHRKTRAPVSRKPKGFSIWESDLMAWMAAGPLHDAIREIDLPGFVSRSDFNALIKDPNYFLWELLIFDLLKRYMKSLH